MSLTILVRPLPTRGADLPLPTYMTAGAAGADIVAAIESPITILPGSRALVPTGLTVAIPAGYEISVRPRSGLSLRKGIVAIYGTIDSDYRGECGVILANLSQTAFTVHRGDRIAQFVVGLAPQAHFEIAEDLPPTQRGTNGFGSTS